MTRDDSRRGRARAVAAVAAVLAGALGLPGTALAGVDVTSSPAEAHQGDAVRLEFVVPEERAGGRTDSVEIRLPTRTPIAEVYPMSVPGWAPRITSQKLDQPVAGIHAAGVDTITASVVWTRASGSPAGPARLALSMGPLPQAERLPFEVIQTYSDGTVVRWSDPAGGAHPAPTLALLPAAPGPAAGGHPGHDAGAAAAGGGEAGASDGGAEAGAAPAGSAEQPGDGGNADSLLAAGLLAGLGGGAAIGWLMSRLRRRGGPADPSDESADDARRLLTGPRDAGHTDPAAGRADAGGEPVPVR